MVTENIAASLTNKYVSIAPFPLNLRGHQIHQILAPAPSPQPPSGQWPVCMSFSCMGVNMPIGSRNFIEHNLGLSRTPQSSRAPSSTYSLRKIATTQAGTAFVVENYVSVRAV